MGVERCLLTKKLKETFHRLGEILVRKRLVESSVVDQALAYQRSEIEQKRSAPKLGDILVKRQILDRRAVREILESQKLHRGEKRILKVDLRERDGVAIISLSGRLDQHLEIYLTRVLERLMNRGIVRIAVDTSDLVYLNSHGASSFVSYVDESRARGGDVKFFGLTADCAFTLERLGLTKFLQLFDTEEEVLRSFDVPIDEYMSRGTLGEYLASEKSRFYHLSYCDDAQKISDDTRVYYESKMHARSDGKTACKRCKP